MSASTVLNPVEQAASQEYEYYGSTLTTNTALKILCLILGAVIACEAVAVVQLGHVAANPEKIYVRINEQGRADVVSGQTFAYAPQAAEARYFLNQFVVGYYGRNHKTVREKYVDALYFLDRPVFDKIDSADQKSQWLPKFLAGADDDIDITVKNIVIENLQTEPYKARVEFTKVFSPTTGTETKRENWTAEFQFRVSKDIPNALVTHNPLGLAITYFREDQAFN
jgi:type IV secretory pathway component VirB8